MNARFLWIVLVLTGALLFTGCRAAATPTPAVPGAGSNAPSQTQGPTDPAELEAFLDHLMASQMEERHIAGAAVSVVKAGQLLFAKGYGYADLEEDIAVDPRQTGFQIGSITKLFTWTAIMQLVEQGKLDLDADINTYLDFRIPDTYPQPITLKHLLTHTAGFEERYHEFNVLQADDLTSVRAWLVSHIPARVRPPGDCAAYSNYGAALAGYIVAQTSGLPYDQYLRQYILEPLGMTHTTAQWPLSPQMRALASTGYTYSDNAFHAFPEYLSQLAVVPAGGMQTSAVDMAHFMIAHLQGGRYSDPNTDPNNAANSVDARILDKATTEQMHSRLYANDPRLLGTTYGFFEFSDNGQRTIGHSGAGHPFYALLLLLPDQDLGIFVAYNSEGGGDLINQHFGFQRAFFDHYYPAPAVAPIQAPADFAQRAGRFTGIYRITTEGSYTTLEKLNVLLGATVKVKDGRDGTLLFATPWGEMRLVEVEPFYFRQVDKPYGVAFRADDQGKITHLFADLTPMLAFEKLSWYETPAFNMALLLVCILIFLSAIVIGLTQLIRNRTLRHDPARLSLSDRAASQLIFRLCFLNLLFIICTYLWGDPTPRFGVFITYKLVLGLGILSAVLTAGALLYTIIAWMNSYRDIATRTAYTLATVAAVAFIWFLNQWNLLGWRY